MARENSKRVVRKSLAQRGPLSVHGDKDPNYEYRFVNDIGSRVQVFREAGYELVEDSDLIVGDSRVSDPTTLGTAKVVTNKDGTQQYLMRIKREWYNEDQTSKEEQNAEIEKALQREASQMDYGKVEIKLS